MSITAKPARDRLDPSERELVTGLAERCARSDGVSPLNESARLSLGADPGRHVHWLVSEDDRLLGYAQWDAREQTVQLMADPQRRREGIGMSLARSVQTSGRTTAQASWWAFGDLPGARALAVRLGLHPVRSLLMMRLPMPDEGAHDAPLPSGLALDHYRDDDLDRLVAVNHAAFADHPEQGAMSADDARLRMSQEWFDPAGLLVARETSGRLVGFHWTKLETHEGVPRGEVYVIGVDPAHEHRGIGRALLDAGIVQMRARGVDAIDLYVEASHPRVVDMYRKAGFAVVSTDTAYANQELNR